VAEGESRRNKKTRLMATRRTFEETNILLKELRKVGASGGVSQLILIFLWKKGVASMRELHKELPEIDSGNVQYLRSKGLAQAIDIAPDPVTGSRRVRYALTNASFAAFVAASDALPEISGE
jgi:hypothetical protein